MGFNKRPLCMWTDESQRRLLRLSLILFSWSKKPSLSPKSTIVSSECEAHLSRRLVLFAGSLSFFLRRKERCRKDHTVLSTKAREKQPTRCVFWSARNYYHLDHPHDTLPFVPLLFGCPSRLRSREIEEEEEKRVASCLRVVWLR